MRIEYLAVVCCVVMACSGADNRAGQDREPTPDRLLAVAKSVSEQKLFEARYNPTRCDCLPIEVKAGTEWHRVVVENASRDSLALERFREQAQRDLEASVHRTYYFTGTLENELRPCERGHVHLIFDLEQYSLEKPSFPATAPRK